MKHRVLVFVAIVTTGCEGTRHGSGDDDGSADACVGLQCNVTDCAAMNAPPTSVSGTVYAPNGTLPLYGIDVYVPNQDPGPVVEGVTCGQCATTLPGYPVTRAVTDEAGHFTLMNVPAGDNIPLIISTGKWRRQITIPHVDACVDLPLGAANTSLPKNKSEGNIPQIAITTGDADALDCLIRKLGIEDQEITTDAGTGRVHLYSGNGANQFKAGFPGGSGTFNAASTLWDNAAKLKNYDIVIFSCEGKQHPETKSQMAMNNVKAYADLGGRVFMSHWHNIWIEGSTQTAGSTQAPAVWPSIATWSNSDDTFGGNGDHDNIDEAANPKGAAFATWMMDVMGSTVRDVIPIGDLSGKRTATTVVNSKAERWVYWEDAGTQYAQNFQFTTPNEVDAGARCGKVVFSDMHVSGDSSSSPGVAYPDECSTAPLTPQEKALAFMFFDISSCVGSIL